MKIPVLICSIFALAVTAAIIKSENAIAGGPSACPAFTTGMIDAAAMAFGLSPGAGLSVAVEDDPNTPSISCIIVEALPNIFELEVNSSDPYSAFVRGQHAQEGGDNLNAELFSYGEQLSVGQMHACRAVILRSFVWKNYCAPLLP